MEGYPKISDERDEFDYHSPVRLFERAGFAEPARENDRLVMRKDL